MDYKITSAKILGSCPEGVLNWVFQEDNLGLIKDTDFLRSSLANGQLHFSLQGKGAVLIKRNNQVGKILEGSGEVAGPVKDGDLYLLCPQRFLELIPMDEIKNSLKDEDQELIAENLTSRLFKNEDTSGVACLILKITEAGNGMWEVGNRNEKPDKLRSGIQKISLQNLTSHVSPLVSKFIKMIRRKPRVLITFALVLLLFISVAKTFLATRNDKQLRMFNSVLNSALDQYQRGKELINLNNARAAQLLSEAKNNLEKTKSNFDQKSTQAKKIIDLLNQINSALDQANQVYKITPQLFFDLNLVKTGAVGSKLALVGDQLFITDQKNSLVYQLDPKTKASKILASKEVKDESEKNNANLYVLDNSKKKVVINQANGNYLAQYQWTSEQKITSMVVSEELKMILLLEGSKIYFIKL